MQANVLHFPDVNFAVVVAGAVGRDFLWYTFLFFQHAKLKTENQKPVLADE